MLLAGEELLQGPGDDFSLFPMVRSVDPDAVLLQKFERRGIDASNVDPVISQRVPLRSV
jgi:hypothetical protein